MLRIGLIADTQGGFDVDALISHVTEQFTGVDEIWHAGDWGRREVLEGLGSIAPLVVVNGNAPDDARFPMTVERVIRQWRVGMIHALDSGAPTWVRGFDIVIHGHTHRWRDEIVDGIRFINPGTATRPQFGGTERSMARLTFGADVRVEKLLVPKFPSRSSLS